jgi:hemerythrin
LAWTEDLSVGVDVLDLHHKRLFALVEEIPPASESGLDAVAKVLAELTDYVRYHFAEEEGMMERSGFPFLELHRHSHQTIALRVADMAVSLQSDNFKRVAEELRLFLTGWLIHHIEIEDFEYRPYLAKA